MILGAVRPMIRVMCSCITFMFFIVVKLVIRLVQCRVQIIDDPHVVANGVLGSFIEACVWDIAATDVQTVEWTIQTFNISLEITTIFSVDIWLIIAELIAVSCPGQPMCSGRGSCVNAVCVCDEGCQCVLLYIFQILIEMSLSSYFAQCVDQNVFR